MDASIIVPSLIEKLQKLLNYEPTIINSKLTDIVQDVMNQLNSFPEYLKCVQDNEAVGHPMNDQWMASLLNAVYSAEDAADTLLTRTALQRQRQAEGAQMRSRHGGFKELCRSICRQNDLSAKEMLKMQNLFANEMTRLMTEVRELSSSHNILTLMQGVALDGSGSSSSLDVLEQKYDSVSF